MEVAGVTTRIRGLLVEDEPPNAKLIKKYLDLEFRGFGWNVKWEQSRNALDARTVVQREPPFDFAIVDYELGQGQQNGPAVVTQIRRSGGGQTFVLVLTGRASKFPAFQHQSRQAGADHAINRGELTADPEHEWSFAKLAGKIRNHLLAHDRAEGVTVAFADDVGIRSTLHSLGSYTGRDADGGERIARSMAIACLEPGYQPKETMLQVSHLAPGRSGAHVCRVDKIRPGEPTESFVLKIGLDVAALRYERDRNADAGRVLRDDTLARIVGDVQVDATSGYAAMAARLATDAVTLASWLTGPGDPPPQRARDAAEVLFGEQLSQLFEPALRHRTPIARWLSSSPVLRLRTEQVLAVYQPVWGDRAGGRQDDSGELAALLADFVATGKLAVTRPARLDGDTTFVGGFGDLHSTNVLIQQGLHDRPVLVDASSYGKQHWATDAARLLVNLTLRVRRSGAPAMLWLDIDDSVRFADRLCPRADRAGDGDREPVDAFVSQILANLPRYLHLEALELPVAAWHWQWHVALAKEFLRQGSRLDLAAPRAVMALTSAAHHLRRAATLVDEIDYGVTSTAST
jgi:CheY-like chemotaxis protein